MRVALLTKRTQRMLDILELIRLMERRIEVTSSHDVQYCSWDYRQKHESDQQIRRAALIWLKKAFYSAHDKVSEVVAADRGKEIADDIWRNLQNQEQ